jgi:RNA polymerase sigma factor for flagellar operon FliA
VLLEDLVSAGVTGLVEAANRFDGSRNVQFKTLAEHRIRGAMLDYLRSLDALPRSVRRFVKDRDTVIAQWKQDTGADPSEDNIATKMGLEQGRFRQLSLMPSSPW